MSLNVDKSLIEGPLPLQAKEPLVGLATLSGWWTQRRPRRIVVVGPCGSGKTTLARSLGRLLGCPAIDIDELYWLPGWKGREEADFCQRLSEAVSAESWILAGNYHRTQHLTWPRADLVIWLDFSLSLSLRRVMRRCITRAIHQEVICNGNRESLRMTFLSRESLLLWVIKVHARHRAAYLSRLAGPPPMLRLRSPGDVNRLSEQLWLLERKRFPADAARGTQRQP